MNRPAQLYSQLQDASKQKRNANIAAHKLRTGRIRHSVNRRKTLQQTNKQTPVPTVALDFLAIGDSWFEYPLYNEIPTPFQNNAIVAQSQLGSLGNPPPQILNQALHGQATTAILSYENQEKMISVLQDADQWLNQQTGLPDGILVSGGGDDLVGDQLAIYLDYGGEAISADGVVMLRGYRAQVRSGMCLRIVLSEIAGCKTPLLKLEVRPILRSPETVSPFEHPDAQRRFRIMEDVEELKRATRQG